MDAHPIAAIRLAAPAAVVPCRAAGLAATAAAVRRTDSFDGIVHNLVARLAAVGHRLALRPTAVAIDAAAVVHHLVACSTVAALLAGPTVGMVGLVAPLLAPLPLLSDWSPRCRCCRAGRPAAVVHHLAAHLAAAGARKAATRRSQCHRAISICEGSSQSPLALRLA